MFKSTETTVYLWSKFQNPPAGQPPDSPVPSLRIKKQGAAKYMQLLEGPPPEDNDDEEQQQGEQTGMQQERMITSFSL